MSRSRDKTGGNTEPMPFVRKFGAAAVAAAAAGESIVETMENAEEGSNGNASGSLVLWLRLGVRIWNWF